MQAWHTGTLIVKFVWNVVSQFDGERVKAGFFGQVQVQLFVFRMKLQQHVRTGVINSEANVKVHPCLKMFFRCHNRIFECIFSETQQVLSCSWSTWCWMSLSGLLWPLWTGSLVHAVRALNVAYSYSSVNAADVWIKTSPDPKRPTPRVRSVFSQRFRGRREVMMLFAFPLSSHHGWMHTAHTPPPASLLQLHERTSRHLQDAR